MSAEEDQRKTENDDERNSVPASAAHRLTIIGNHLDSRKLFAGTREIVILHGSDTYRLRLTAQNKLILTK
jgi:hemin uptake protein HemP